MDESTTVAVRLERDIAAPREHVFRAWTDATLLSRWFSPDPSRTCAVRALDVRPGGAFEIDMPGADGRAFPLRCVFEEVDPPERLALSWRWADNPADGVSRVIVQLTEIPGGTRLVLVHEALPTADARQRHTNGWTRSLARLAEVR